MHGTGDEKCWRVNIISGVKTKYSTNGVAEFDSVTALNTSSTQHQFGGSVLIQGLPWFSKHFLTSHLSFGDRGTNMDAYYGDLPPFALNDVENI